MVWTCIWIKCENVDVYFFISVTQSKNSWCQAKVRAISRPSSIIILIMWQLIITGSRLAISATKLLMGAGHTHTHTLTSVLPKQSMHHVGIQSIKNCKWIIYNNRLFFFQSFSVIWICQVHLFTPRIWAMSKIISSACHMISQSFTTVSIELLLTRQWNKCYCKQQKDT